MTHQNLLVELFVEELPPKALKKLGESFASVLFEQLKAQGLASAESKLTSFASPRRLAAHVTAVAAEGSTSVIPTISPTRTAAWVAGSLPTKYGMIGGQPLPD